MKIGKVAETLGIPASTIRFYERKGLIKKQSRISGAREFNSDSILALRFVQLAQKAGFTIDEMKLLLENYTQNSDVTAMWRLRATEKRREVQAQMADLQLRVQMSETRRVY